MILICGVSGGEKKAVNQREWPEDSEIAREKGVMLVTGLPATTQKHPNLAMVWHECRAKSP
jgi:hypothetical protein